MSSSCSSILSILITRSYEEFITISKEISTLENDMLELKESLSEWKSMPSLLKIEEASSATGAPLARRRLGGSDSSQTVDGRNDHLLPTFEYCMLLNYRSCTPPSRAHRNSSPPPLADTLSVKFLTSTLSIPQPTRLNTPFTLCSLMMPC